MYERYLHFIPVKRKESLRVINNNGERYTVLPNSKREGLYEKFFQSKLNKAYSNKLMIRYTYFK